MEIYNSIVSHSSNRVHYYRCLLIASVLLLLFLPYEEATAQPVLTGDADLIIGVTTTGKHEIVPGVQRLTLNLDHRFDGGRLLVRTDVRNRFEASADSLEWSLPEFWLEFYFSHGDLRVGKQIIQPGFSAFQSPLNRIQPLDIRNFLLEPEPVLRRGTVAVSYSWFPGNSRFEAILSPVHTPSLMPSPQSRWFIPVPVPPGIPLKIVANDHDDSPAIKPQAALLWNSGRLGDLELHAGILYWIPSQPAYFKQVSILSPDSFPPSSEVLLSETFTPTLIFNGAVSWQVTNRVSATVEMAWFQARAFDRIPEVLREFSWDAPDPLLFPVLLQIISTEEKGFLSRHNTAETVLDFTYSGTDMTYGVQWGTRIIRDPHPDVIQDRIFHTLIASARRGLLRQRLISEVSMVYHPSGNDFWIRSEHSYDLMDNVAVSAGAHFFGGPVPETNYGDLSFGSYRGNSLLYAGVRYYF